MKQGKDGYLYVCDNCNFEFYLKNKIKDRMVECSRCGEKTAYCEDNFSDDDIYSDIDDNIDNNFFLGETFNDSEIEEHYDYPEW